MVHSDPLSLIVTLIGHCNCRQQQQINKNLLAFFANTELSTLRFCGVRCKSMAVYMVCSVSIVFLRAIDGTHADLQSRGERREWGGW